MRESYNKHPSFNILPVLFHLFSPPQLFCGSWYIVKQNPKQRVISLINVSVYIPDKDFFSFEKETTSMPFSHLKMLTVIP